MQKINNHAIEVIIHTAVWAYMLATPFLFARHNETLHWQQYVECMVVPMALCIVFYVNYFVLVPRYFMQQRNKTFFTTNLLLIASCTTCIVVFMHYVAPILRESIMADGAMEGMHHKHHQGPHHGGPMRGKLPPPHDDFYRKIIMLTMRDVFSEICAVVVAIGIRLSSAWRKAAEQRKETQLLLANAALKDLKSQTSPHFLLNTLNNIYSLTAFDTEKAQHAISELSKMLRYQLYESDAEKVLLRKETDFLNNYIELMRLRVSDQVKVETSINIAPDESIVIAPHILISLVENAFKHGVSSQSPSFISISLDADLERIQFVCTNSYHPQTKASDKTQGGIGLHQVEQRLRLVYDGYYEWNYGPSADGQTYHSELVIYNDAQTD